MPRWPRLAACQVPGKVRCGLATSSIWLYTRGFVPKQSPLVITSTTTTTRRESTSESVLRWCSHRLVGKKMSSCPCNSRLCASLLQSHEVAPGRYADVEVQRLLQDHTMWSRGSRLWKLPGQRLARIACLSRHSRSTLDATGVLSKENIAIWAATSASTRRMAFQTFITYINVFYWFNLSFRVSNYG